ncbi:MAG: hypothetical protein ACD_46C00578G0002 [uncultured bacterium]|nr:MAG: hypothetical protein ACD_46C00578G0002 [uncultured bacterium]
MQQPFSFGRLIVASSMGNILEWYDFSLFAFFTPIFARLYFPHENKLTGMLLTYAIFAVGFLVRPLGAILFGHYGDRRGRKKTLIYSILLMSLATCGMGLLPTYYQMGIWAPVLLILLRIMQGLSVGGESIGAALFVLESVPSKRRGFLSALLWSMTGIGMLLGSAVGALIMQFPQHDLLWRIPFLLGIFTGVLGYFVRQRIPEAALFNYAVTHEQIVKFPFRHVFTTYRHELLIAIGIYALSAMITYLIFIFMSSYAANNLGMPLATTSLISMLGLLMVTLLVPVGGYLSDCWGRKKSVSIAAAGFALVSYPLFYFISQGKLQNYIVAELCFVVLAASFQGAITATVLEMLPTKVRYSVAAIAYNISYSIFGGTAPLLAAYLIKITGHVSAPGMYLVAGAILACYAASFLRETAYGEFH